MTTPPWDTPTITRAAFRGERPRSQRPNVVVVVLDDVGFAQLGAFGAEIHTPNIDALAAGGLSYNRFHVTSICSSSRAALLTGRNHHAVGMGSVADVAHDAPGYTSRIPKSAACLPRILGDAGYHTIAIGKWHLTPNGERGQAGPYRQWPLGVGFDRYYGFLRADTNQWTPNLTCDNHAVDPPRRPDEGYHLTEDLADRAISYVLAQQHDGPERPFFLYFAPGAMHAPHHVTQEWVAPYAGAFDDGWSRMRDRIFDRQLAQGIVPAGAVLPEQPSWVPDWDDLDPDRRRLYARMHEVYAGFLTHTDAQIGRLLSLLDEIDELDNTIVIVTSDNGASAEGGVDGAVNEHNFTMRLAEDPAANLAALDEWGGRRGYYHYAWGWAWAGNTPLRLWKRYAWLGGTRTPMVVHWPDGITAKGEVRSQFCHIVDLMPTLLDVCGVEPPDAVDGIDQQPIDGASLTATFDAPEAPAPRSQQYFEMMGSRSIISGSWKATTDHVMELLLDEARLLTGSRDYATDTWQLFDLDRDFAECVDVARHHPEVVERLRDEWFAEAERNHVFPLLGGWDPRIEGIATSTGIAPVAAANDVPRLRLLRPGGPPITDEILPNFVGGGLVVANVTCPDGAPDGVLCAIGDWTQGWAMFVADRYLHFCFNIAGVDSIVRAHTPVPGGHVRLGARLDKRRGVGLDITLLHDDTEVGTGSTPYDSPAGMLQVGGAGLCLGYDRGFPVSTRYAVPATFNGEIHFVTVSATSALASQPSKQLRRALHED